MTITINKPAATAINKSLAVVLSVGEKTPLTTEQITPSKRVNEQECYAALIHNALESTNPKIAKRFEQELQQAAEKYKENHGDINMFKVSDRLMRQYVREKEISQEQYQGLRNHAFGHAQLDSDRTRLSVEKADDAKSGDTPLRAVSTFHSKLETNQVASASEIAQFRAHEAEISVQKWRERKETGTVGKGEAVTSEGAAETVDIKDVPKGFLWKPQSDSDGRLVVLLPPSLTTSVHSLVLKDSKGEKLIDSGRYAGIGNGGRLHFRFGKSGGNYPDGTVVEVTLTNGEVARIPIRETSARVET